jgi:hypothetical protein
MRKEVKKTPYKLSLFLHKNKFLGQKEDISREKRMYSRPDVCHRTRLDRAASDITARLFSDTNGKAKLCTCFA